MKYPPPATPEEHIEAAAAITRDTEILSRHVRSCAVCFDAAEAWRAKPEDQDAALLKMAIISWWVDLFG